MDPVRAEIAETPPYGAPSASVGFWGPGSWCWFADPRAVHAGGETGPTFVGWISPAGAVTVGEADPDGHRSTFIVGRLYHDDHGSPALYVEPDKRLTVFFSAHNGSAMYYRTTLEPDSIAGWGPIHRVPGRMEGDLGFTYPNPVDLPAEHDRLYLFWRGGTWGQDYATQTVAGIWSPIRALIEDPNERPYVKVAANHTGSIAFAYTNGHPRNLTTSIYYAAYAYGWLRHADGHAIKRMGTGPITPAQGDLVFDGPAHGYSAWVWDVAFSHRDRPVIVYATFQNPQSHEYWYATWTGTRWVSRPITDAGPTISPGTIEDQYSGGITLDHDDPQIVYLSRKVNGWFEIERWTTPDGGQHWTHSVVARDPGQDDVRPVVTRGTDGGPMSLLWLQGHYGSYTTYNTRIAYLTR